MGISSYITPAIMAAIIIGAFVKKVPLYDSVTAGAEEGMGIVLNIFPTMVAMLTAVAMLNASGAFSMLIRLIAPVTEFLHIPEEVLPMAMIRPISGSGALGVLTDMLGQYGPDSRIGRICSVIMGSTETTFYTLCVYFGATKVKYTKRAIPCAIIGDLVGILVSVLIIR